jgi:AbrB family looped-hinge helix DNA binding protein
MALAQSRLTAQGQISVPGAVRRTLGIGPGSVIEWSQEGDKVVVRKAAKFTMKDVHRALFPKGPPSRKSAKALRDGIRTHIRKKHARR